MSDGTGIAPENQRISVGSPYFAELIEASRSTPMDEIDALLQTLQAQKEAWVRLEISERLAILDEIVRDLYQVKNRWVRAELEAKRLPSQTLGEAEEWALLATVFRAVRKLRESLFEIQQRGRPKIPGSLNYPRL